MCTTACTTATCKASLVTTGFNKQRCYWPVDLPRCWSSRMAAVVCICKCTRWTTLPQEMQFCLRRRRVRLPRVIEEPKPGRDATLRIVNCTTTKNPSKPTEAKRCAIVCMHMGCTCGRSTSSRFISIQALPCNQDREEKRLCDRRN
jgi:hypothetical protein